MTFTVPLQDTSITEEDSVILTCELSKPDQKPAWLKNGKEIQPDDRVDISVDGTVHKLTIPKSAVDDSAEYTVKLGDLTTAAKLAVNGECM